ncbi:unnamed protein product [Closterium sp. NIES-65]|nr:unnamed protein product [Closterium sp. NIES-65]
MGDNDTQEKTTVVVRADSKFSSRKTTVDAPPHLTGLLSPPLPSSPLSPHPPFPLIPPYPSSPLSPHPPFPLIPPFPSSPLSPHPPFPLIPPFPSSPLSPHPPFPLIPPFPSSPLSPHPPFPLIPPFPSSPLSPHPLSHLAITHQLLLLLPYERTCFRQRCNSQREGQGGNAAEAGQGGNAAEGAIGLRITLAHLGTSKGRAYERTCLHQRFNSQRFNSHWLARGATKSSRVLLSHADFALENSEMSNPRACEQAWLVQSNKANFSSPMRAGLVATALYPADTPPGAAPALASAAAAPPLPHTIPTVSNIRVPFPHPLNNSLPPPSQRLPSPTLSTTPFPHPLNNSLPPPSQRLPSPTNRGNNAKIKTTVDAPPHLIGLLSPPLSSHHLSPLTTSLLSPAFSLRSSLTPHLPSISYSSPPADVAAPLPLRPHTTPLAPLLHSTSPSTHHTSRSSAPLYLSFHTPHLSLLCSTLPLLPHTTPLAPLLHSTSPSTHHTSAFASRMQSHICLSPEPSTPLSPSSPPQPSTPLSPSSPPQPSTPLSPSSPPQPSTPLSPSSPPQPSTPVTPNVRSPLTSAELNPQPPSPLAHLPLAPPLPSTSHPSPVLNSTLNPPHPSLTFPSPLPSPQPPTPHLLLVNAPLLLHATPRQRKVCRE